MESVELTRDQLFRLFIERKINHENFSDFGISKAKYYKMNDRYKFWKSFTDPFTEMVLRLSNNQFLGITKPNVKIAKKIWKGFSPPAEKEPNDAHATVETLAV